MQAPLNIRVLPDSAAVAEAALDLVLQAASDSIRQRGRFVIALAGGSTPKRLYQLLAGSGQEWERWHLVYGDERCLPHGDPQRNSTLMEESWLSQVDFPRKNHLLPDFSSGVAQAAADYNRQIAPLLPLDFALLGMGEDGHTASLFPGAAIFTDGVLTDDVFTDDLFNNELAVIPVTNAPKLPRERITLSYAALNQTRTVCFIVTGESKREALQAWHNGADLPVSRISGREKTCLLTDLTPP